MLDVSFSSSISHLLVFHPVTPCNYVHPCNKGEKYGNRHIQSRKPGNACSFGAEFAQSILSLETELLKSPASQRVHEGDFLLSCHHCILNVYFPACCNFKEGCFISRFNSTWETNEVSLNAIIVTAAMCFLQVDVPI